MWSGPEAAGGVATTHPELRRGHVWLAQVAPDRAQRAVLLLSRDRDSGVDDPVLAAPVVRGLPAPGRVAVEIPAGVDGAVVDVRRLTAIDRSALIQPLARLAAPSLAEVDMALCDVLGLDMAAWHSADELERRLLTVNAVFGDADPSDPDASAPAGPAALADEVVASQPVMPAATNGASRRQQPAAAELLTPFAQPAALDQMGFAPPPAPPPMVETAASADEVRDGENTSSALEDHPIAQLFGRPRPASPMTAAAITPVRSPAADIRAADVMPELLAIVQRRLHRSAPRLEAVLSQAGEEGRNLEWAAAAVRHASVRGVMQSTLDEIASEIAAVGSPEVRRPPAR